MSICAIWVSIWRRRAQLRQDDLVARHSDPVPAGRPILDQSNPSDMQLLDFVQLVCLDRGRLEAEHGTHACKHLRIDAVGLRSLSGRLREASRPCGVHLDVVMAGSRKRRLQIAVIAPGRLVDNAERHRPEPLAHGLQAGRVVAEAGPFAVRETVDVESGLRDIDPDGVGHGLFASWPCHSGQGREAFPMYPFRTFEKAGAITLLTGPLRPSPQRSVPRRCPAYLRCRTAAPVSHGNRGYF